MRGQLRHQLSHPHIHIHLHIHPLHRLCQTHRIPAPRPRLAVSSSTPPRRQQGSRRRRAADVLYGAGTAHIACTHTPTSTSFSASLSKLTAPPPRLARLPSFIASTPPRRGPKRR
ncbi:hypothetical protein B0H11DRAFT_2257393 [Mycena galericulata]|nr:hypothetical protein B0H11DRAFT_2257393 [Mycena galericulata]